ncbi:MAG TPA: hypothetical protein VGR62_05145 [Candidatus Binatia bacterium]|nr:hypothetical protein [Candidatus Binatia bacterium]
MAPEDALEPALRALLGASGATAGAVCLFDCGDAVLRLAAEIGLSDAGCTALRVLRAGGDGWEAPLATLRERRAQLTPIDPPALTDPPQTAVVCVPLIVDDRPLGIAVLAGPRVLDDDDLDHARTAITVLAGVVDQIHRRVAAITTRATAGTSRFEALAESTLRSIGPVVDEVRRLLDWARDLPGVSTLVEQLGGVAPRDVERLRHLQQTVSTLERRTADTAEQALARLAVIELELIAERGRTDAAEREHERTANELADMVAREQRARAELDIVMARSAADRVETLRAARELTAAAEEQRAAAAAEAEAARAALAAADTAMLALRDEVRRATDGTERLAGAEQAARIAREQAQRALEEARGRETAAVDEAQRHATATEELETECQRLAEAATAGEARRVTEREAAGQELARLHARVQVVEAEQIRRAEELAAAVARAQAAQTELTLVRERSSAERDAEVERARALTASTEEARVLAVGELEALRESMAEAQAIILHMEAVAALDEQGNADRERALSHTLDVSRQNEQARAAAVSELERLRGALTAVQAEGVAARDDARRAVEELERLRAASGDRDRLAAALAEARSREDALAARVAALEPQLAALREERTRQMDGAREQTADLERRLRAKLTETEAACTAERERVRAVEAEREQLAAELEEAVVAQWRARDELAATLARGETHREETLRHARELSEAAEKARAAAAGETESLRTALADTQALVLQAEDQARQTAAELERLRAAEETAQAEQRRLTALLEDARLRDTETARRQSEQASTRPRSASPPQPTEPRPAPPAAPSPTVAPSASAKSLVVIDLDLEWSAGEGSVLAVTVVAPGADLVARITELSPSHIMVNLAAAGVFQAMIALRSAGCTTRFVGCLARPNDDKTMVLGLIEPGPRPADPEVLVSLLTGYAPRAARIMAAGTDANTFISLRQALTRAGMSVSIAWDAKQASDLLEIVRPQLLVLDLGLPPRGAHGLVTQAAGTNPAPVAVLIPGPADPASGFLAAMLDRAATAGVARTRAVQDTLRRPDEPPSVVR